MNPAADYSSSYLVLYTSTGLFGHGFSFTIGRGNDLVCSAASQIAERLVGKNLAELTADMGNTWRYLVEDSQLRWIGPEKGVIHLGLSACVNALWDLWARYLGKPVWQVVADMTPEEFVRCIDFRYILDAITPEEAIDMLRRLESNKSKRLELAKKDRAVPAYSTQAGWLGYSDAKMVKLLRDQLHDGLDKFKLKVGGNIEDDRRRLQLAREVVGYDKMLMVDANQVWSVPEAIEYMLQLVEFKPE
jgi:L-galactonate dehydratase